MEALILQQSPRGERDVLVTLLGSDDTQYHALAKGVRDMQSKLRAGLLPLTIADAELVAGRGGWIARSCAPLLDCTALRSDPAALAGGRMLAAILSELAGGNRHETPRFVRAAQLLRDLNTAVLSGEPRALLRRRATAVWVAALELAGYLPEFRHCVVCRNETILGIDPRQGGGVCASHVGPETIRLEEKDIQQLRTRHVPNTPDAVTACIGFLERFSAERFPALAGEARWAASALLN
jgi:DNA repair protein RecO